MASATLAFGNFAPRAAESAAVHPVAAVRGGRNLVERTLDPDFSLVSSEGISKEGDLLDLAANHNIVEKSGAWFSYKGERIGQGRENGKQFLKENKDIAAKIEAEVRKALNIGGAGEKAQPVAVPADGRAAPVPPVVAARAMGTMKK